MRRIPVLQGLGVEIDQEAEADSGQTQIGENLGEGNRVNPFHCFDFDDDAALDHEIEPVAASSRTPL